MNPRTSLITSIHREGIGSMGKLLVRFSRATMYYLIGSSNKNEEIKKKNREFSSIKNSALPSLISFQHFSGSPMISVYVSTDSINA